MTDDLRLLLVLGSLESRYADASARELSEMFATAGRNWQIHLVSSRLIRYKETNFKYQSHKIAFTPSPRSFMSRIVYLVFLLFKSVGIVKKYKIHCVMAKSGHLLLGPVAYLTSRITNRKCIIRVNEDTILDIILFVQTYKIPVLNNKAMLALLEKTLRGAENLLFKHVDWIVTHGPMDYERIKKVTPNVTFVPLWIDVEAFRPVSRDEAIALKGRLVNRDNTKVVLFVGRLHSNKDPSTLLRAFKELAEMRNDVVLVVIGTSPEERTYFELAKELGITKKVRFLGYIPHIQIAEYYGVADVYVLTSIWEEWSNTIMEAMASGIPVVATNVGANPYMIKDGETGFLFPRGDPHTLAERISYILNHPDEMNLVSRNARLSMEEFTKEKIGELHKRIIKEVIAGKKPKVGYH